MESIFRPALTLMFGRALAFAGTFFIPVVLVRIFDQAEFGTYKQLFLIFATFYAIAQFGMAESLYFFLPATTREGGRYVTNSTLCLAGAGAGCLALVSVAGPKMSQWLSNPELLRYLPLLGIFLLLAMISAGFEMVMISRKRYLWASWTYGISDLLRAACFLAPALLFHSLEWLLMGAIAFALFRLGAAFFYYRREFQGGLRPDGALLKKQLAYAIPFGMAVAIEILQANFPQYAVSHRFDAATFAIYSVGCLQIPLVDFVAAPAANVMMVRMSENIQEGRGGSVLELWHDTTRKLALLFFPLFALVLVSARQIVVLLFTEDYLASVPIFMVWSTTLLLAVLQVDSVLRVYARTRFIFLLNMVRLLLMVALIHWFLSAFYLVGAVLVTVLALGIGKGMALLKMRSLMNARFSQLLPWRSLGGILAVAGAAGMVALFIKSELSLSTFPLLLATGVTYAVSYGALVFVFGLLSDSERLALMGWLQRPPMGAAKV